MCVLQNSVDITRVTSTTIIITNGKKMITIIEEGKFRRDKVTETNIENTSNKNTSTNTIISKSRSNINK